MKDDKEPKKKKKAFTKMIHHKREDADTYVFTTFEEV